MTAVDLPLLPGRPDGPQQPQADLEHKHNYGQCLTQWCPKWGITARLRRCLGCGACQHC